MSSKHFVIIGNYPPDRQESMIRFAQLMADGIKNRGISVETLAPRPILVGENSSPNRGLLKWLAYVDKWILFPISLRRIVRKRRKEFGDNVSYHICDQSNSPYLAHLPREHSGISCHDVLAIRGAMGHADAYCAASRTGVILQRWILKNLKSAKRLACSSHLTMSQLCELAGQARPKLGWKVLHIAFNAEFKKVEKLEALQILERQGIKVPQPFLLHVGSNLPRKNRRMLLQMIAQTGQTWPGHVCFAGEAMDDALSAEARALGLLDRVHAVARPNHETLCALYSLAHAFVFPSFSEGFGWPVIEAQACGAPVIAGNLEPLPEVSGDAALHADPHDAKSFASALQKLNDPTVRDSVIEAGFKNTARFSPATMIEGYLALHELGLSESVAAAS